VPRDTLRQILLNLLKNSVEAMPDGGQLQIATATTVLDDKGRCIEISIRDNGPGLPDEVRERLFRPVFTKKGGTHAGLGLSITSQLVRELRGLIHCRTGPDGTEFVVLLPSAQDD
jgi:signal transduction histidine kinase